MSEKYQPNKYVGDDVILRNALDQYDNVTYTTKLYMITDDDGAGGGYFNNATSAAPDQTVVLCQTGVTNAQITNLSIDIIPTVSKTFDYRANFTVRQPNAVDFFDQIQIAKNYLQIAGTPKETALILEIGFRGYAADPDDEDAGGIPVTDTQIAGPYRYILYVNTADISIDETGSTYNFRAVSMFRKAYSMHIQESDYEFKTKGPDIPTHVGHFVRKLNTWRLENHTDHQIVDQFDIDLSRLSSALGEKLDLNFAEKDTATTLRRLMDTEEPLTYEQLEQTIREKNKSVESEDIGDVSNQVTVAKGDSVYKYLFTLLCMNNAFLDGLTRAEAFGDLSKPVNINQAFVKWMKLNVDVKILGWDSVRKVYATKTTYIPEIVDVSDPAHSCNPNENAVTQPSTNSRLQELTSSGALRKSYHYMFTGLNDQILTVDLNYDAGLIFLIPPGYGNLGTIETTPVNPGKIDVDPDEDLKDTQKKAQAVISALTKALQGGFSGSTVVDNLLGSLSENEKTLIRDNQERLAEVATAVADFDLGLETASTNTNVNVDDGSQSTDDNTALRNYTPDVFAADLLTGGPSAVETTSESIKATAAAKQALSQYNTEVSESLQCAPQPPSIASGATGGKKATLFAYYYQNAINPGMLQELNMTIKGDPWYLGNNVGNASTHSGQSINTGTVYENFAQATDAHSVYKLGTQHFIFEMQTPRQYDYGVDDEDTNTGLWQQMNTDYFFSGVYMIHRVTANFSNGVFTVDIRAKRNSDIILSLIETDNTQEQDTQDQE